MRVFGLILLSIAISTVAAASPTPGVEWSREVWRGYGASPGGVLVASDGAVYVVGTASVDRSNTDLSLVKLDSAGRAVWRRRLGGPRPDGGRAIAGLPGGDVVVAGFAESRQVSGERRHGRSDIMTARFSADGVPRWVRLHGGCGGSGANDIATRGDMIVVTGSHVGSDTPCRQRPDAAWYAPIAAVVLRYTPRGDLAWSRFLQPDGGGDAVGAASAIDANDDIYLVGRSMSWYGDAGERLFAARLTADGKVTWKRTFESVGEARGRDGVILAGGLQVAGHASGIARGDGNQRALLARVSRDGHLESAVFLGHPHRHQGFIALAVAADGTILVAGSVSATGDGGDVHSQALLASYRPGGNLEWSLVGAPGEIAEAAYDIDARDSRILLLGVRSAPSNTNQTSITVTSYTAPGDD